jgi:hypothetical protein
VLTFISKAFANIVVQMAFDTKVMSASNNTVYKNAADRLRDRPPHSGEVRLTTWRRAARVRRHGSLPPLSRA